MTRGACARTTTFKGMLFEFNRYSSLLLIFFVHGLVYAALLALRYRREGRRADGWLALFLLLCAAYITPWMVGFAGWYDTQPYRDFLFYVPFQHLFALGPVMYAYVQCLLNPSVRFGKKEALHFLPAALYLLYSLGVWVTDHFVLRRYWFLANGLDPDFAPWYQGLGFLSMGYYALRALRYHRQFRGLMLQVTSYADKLRFAPVRRFLQLFLAMLALRLLFFGAALLGADNYADTWWYFFGFALLAYALAISGYAESAVARVAYQPLASGDALLLLPAAGLPDADAYLAEEEPIPLQPVAPGPDPQWADWLPRLEQLLGAEAVYRDPELNLGALARRLGIPSAQLSRGINGHYGQNFNDFINGYRVRAVQAAIRAGEHRQQTLVGIAYDCGFNSKATFNRSFLKIAGQTPKAFAGEEATSGG